jgi:hypothetical protein
MRYLKLFESYNEDNESYMQYGIKSRFDELKDTYSIRSSGIIFKKIKDDYNCLLLFIDKELIGYIDYNLYKEDKEIYVESIYIDEYKRRGGYATTMIDKLKSLYPTYEILKDLDYTKLGKKFFKTIK